MEIVTVFCHGLRPLAFAAVSPLALAISSHRFLGRLGGSNSRDKHSRALPSGKVVPRPVRNVALPSEAMLLELNCTSWTLKFIWNEWPYTSGIFIFVTCSSWVCRDSGGQHSLPCKRTGSRTLFFYSSPLSLSGTLWSQTKSSHLVQGTFFRACWAIFFVCLYLLFILKLKYL